MVNEPVSLKTESTDYQTTVQDNVVEDKLNYEVKQLEYNTKGCNRGGEQ